MTSAPELEHDEGPQPLAVVGAAGGMFAQENLDAVAPEEPVPGEQQVAREVA